jgi:hypothetical protein
MRMVRAALVLAAVAAVPVGAAAQADRPGQPPDAISAAHPDAYLDDAARDLVRDARNRRRLVDNRILSYGATAHERVSVSLRAGIGERLLLRRETASRIDWTRDTVRVHVLAAREVLPVVKAATQIPAGLPGYMPSLAFDPVDSEMLLRFDTSGIRNPLAAGGEAHYRFAAGDSTVIRLPDGRQVKLRELRIMPRRRDPQLMNGSFWIDDATHAVVQAYFRLARAYDSRRDGDSRRSLLAPSLQAELDYIAIDYGYWDLRWWLPRTVAVHGVIRVAGIRMPMSYERRYDDYVIEGDPSGAVAERDEATPPRPCRPRVRFVVNATAGAPDSARDEARAEARADARAERRRQDARGDTVPDPADACDRAFIVTTEPDAELMTSALLPADIYGGDSGVIDAAELRAIAERVRAIAPAPWQLMRPIVEAGPTGPGLLRYNRVEGVSIGARALLDFGVATAVAELRVGTAAGEVGALLGLTRPGAVVDGRLAAYRRLDVVDVAAQPFTAGSSLGALLLGSDDNDYFRATGAELQLRPPDLRRQWWDMRLFAERQDAVSRQSGFSVPRLLGSDGVVRDNIAAAPATQFGATLRLRAAHGRDPSSIRVGAELEVHGEAGDYELVRPALRLRSTLPLGRRLSLGAEVAGGSGFGNVPPQRLWQVGGAGTLRGYEGASTRGESFWRARTELALGLPLARVALFGDAARAGPRAELFDTRPLRSAGVGVSVLDGLLRFDVARALDAPRGWRLHVQLDSVL